MVLALVIGISSLFAGGIFTDLGEDSASSKSAPDITLATATGSFQLSEHQGEVVVLYFSFPG